MLDKEQDGFFGVGPGVIALRDELQAVAVLSNLLQVTERFSSQFWPTPLDRVQMTKEYLLHMVSEIDEVLRELDWKVHRRSFQQTVRSNLVEELIDLWKFWLSIVALWDLQPAEVMQAFWRKTAVVEQRHQQEQALKATTAPIVIVDIDGVLADYSTSFARYVAAQTQRPLLLDDGSYENFIAGFSRRDIVRWKQRYREEGFEGEHVLPFAEAASFMTWLGHRKLFRCVVTARPYTQYKRLFADTLRWFRKHEVPFETLVFAEDKQAFALSLLDHDKQIAFAVEDNPVQARSLVSLDIPVFLITRPYNANAVFDGLPVHRVNSLMAVLRES